MESLPQNVMKNTFTSIFSRENAKVANASIESGNKFI